MWAVLTLAVVVGALAWLWLLRGDRLLERLTLLQIGWFAGAATAVVATLLLLTTPVGAIRVTPRLGKRVLITGGALLAAASLLLIVPVTSRDALRYRADGTAWLVGVSPYVVTPAEVQPEWFSEPGSAAEPTSEAIVHAVTTEDPFEPAIAVVNASTPSADRTTTHLPVAQVAFLTARALEYVLPMGTPAAGSVTGTAVEQDWRIAVAELPWWRQLWVLRLFWAGAYLLTLGELIAWLRHREKSVWWTAIFAWPPVVWLTGAGFGHMDVLGVLFLISGLRRVEIGRVRRAAMCLSAAAAVSPLALVALPFAIGYTYAGREHSDPTAARRLAVWSAGTLVLLFGPVLMLQGGYASFARAVWDAWTDGAAHEASLVYRLAGAGLGDIGLLVVVALATVAAGIVTWTRRAGPVTSTYAVLLVLLLIGPDAGPEKVVWLLALVPVLPRGAGLAALVWAGTSALQYTPASLAEMPVNLATLAVQSVPVYIAAVLELVIVPRRRPKATATGPSPAVAAS